MLTLVATVVEVDKVLLELAGQSAGVNGVTVVLAGDVALASGQVEGGDVVGAVAVLELNRSGADGEGEELVAQADSHDGDGRSIHETGEAVDSFLAMSRVAGAVGDEDTIEVLSHLVDGVVVGQNCDGSATADEASENVLLDAAVDEGNVQVGAGGLDDKRSLGANTLDQVDLARVDKALIFVGVVLVTNGDSGERGTLLSEEGDDFSGINSRNSGDALAGAPLAQTLNGSPVAVVEGNIGHDNTGALNVGGFKVLEEVVLVALFRGDSVVANQGLGEDEDLTAVGRVGHGLGVSDEGRGKDSLARDVSIGAKGFSTENGTILESSG